MGSVNSIPINNATTWHIGSRQVVASGVPFSRTRTVTDVLPSWNVELGTQPSGSDRTTTQINPKQKVSSSETNGVYSRKGATYVPTSDTEPEIEYKTQSQYGTVGTGGRVVVRTSDGDNLIGRKSNG